jgi:hypothetical protein
MKKTSISNAKNAIKNSKNSNVQKTETKEKKINVSGLLHKRISDKFYNENQILEFAADLAKKYNQKQFQTVGKIREHCKWLMNNERMISNKEKNLFKYTGKLN